MTDTPPAAHHLNVHNILGYLNAGLELFKTLAPLTGLGGDLVAHIANIGATVSQVAETVNAKVAEGTVVMQSQDQAELKRILADIQAENDKLAEAIANS